jgi:hypothetical protein
MTNEVFWLEVFDKTKEEVLGSMLIYAPTVEIAWQFVAQELSKNNITFDDTIDLRLVQNGHKGVKIVETETQFELYFDDSLLRTLDKQFGTTAILEE